MLKTNDNRKCKSCDNQAYKGRRECNACKHKRRKATSKPCRMDGCKRYATSKGLCNEHRRRELIHGSPELGGPEPGALLRWLEEVVENPPTGCALWPFKSITGKGYGTVRYKGRLMGAHRVALILFEGRDPENLHCCHAPVVCHNTLCCNPLHLRFATVGENFADRVKDGTNSKRLSNKQAMSIFNDPRSNREIADSYSLNISTVRNIKVGNTWSALTGKIKRHSSLSKG